MKKLMIPLVIVVALFQLGSLGIKIYKLENALTHGELHLFKTAPIDPYDPFRGRYVALSQESLNIEYDVAEQPYLSRGSRIWVTVEKNEDGYSKFGRIAEKGHEGPKVKARVQWKNATGEIRIKPPFSRFYMNEKEAPRAERVYRRNTTREKRNAHLAVRILDGVGVIEDLYIDGKPIDQYLKENPEDDGPKNKN